MRATGRFVYDFDERSEGGRELLGGKGVGLAEMTQLGVPVPAGFTVTTDACRAYMQNGKELPDGLEPEIERHLSALEDKTSKRFGDSSDPLLVSVRSGAAVSMPEDLGTAVNVVQMVFGNKGATSGTGVAFTRDPSTGEQGLYGEFLTDAQGEDVVSGIRTPEPLGTMEKSLPEPFEELLATMRRLEEHYRDMQDIEFTVEDGRLYLLQTRSAKRTATAALRSAVSMVEEGLISREEAVARIDAGQLDQLLHPMIDPKAEVEVAARGLNASPGAASGKAVLDADAAEERGQAGEDVILVRWETTPDDIHGLLQANGILTAHGGMTSHAAVVARGMGKPCVAGCEGLTIDLDARTFSLNGRELAEGDVITIDGGTC